MLRPDSWRSAAAVRPNRGRVASSLEQKEAWLGFCVCGVPRRRFRSAIDDGRANRDEDRPSGRDCRRHLHRFIVRFAPPST